MTEWLVATHNLAKLAELAALLRPYGHTVRAAESAPLEEGPLSLAANARAKVEALHRCYPHTWGLADDSGLFARGLPGALGVQTARRLPRNGTNAALLTLLAGRDRRVTLVSVLALATPSGRVTTATGRLVATVADAPRGTESGGFDRLLVPVGATQTLAQMSALSRATYLPRARALTQLLGGFADAVH
ncbi:non-canonical purine NTP pyrophosphatase [Lacticaseibacillus absianus]|uniref:non-canonical purine NTP pyrophosphatase n=1 Tax=Lacticaseibacillus absianus TaxID=2729623 RepID=UPI0015C78F97|nr:non-canonical purine NTP pyrophosphatase [Lacticaseibacillus absianus]